MELKKKSQGQMSRILIIGAGEIGRALNFVLKQNRANQVLLWDRRPEKVKNWRPLDEAVISFEPKSIFLAIPTRAIAEVVEKVLRVRREDFCFVLLSKGLDQEGKTPLEIIQEFWLGPTAIISGPMLAEELIQGLETGAMVAGNLPATVDQLVNLFEATNLSLEKTADLIGLSWCGPLKNIYSIGLGISAAQNRGRNYQGWFVAQAVREMIAIVKFFGGRKETVYSPAGIGDLVATGFSPDSSNYQFGFSLQKGERREKLPEGVAAAVGLKHRLGKELEQWPLLKEIVNKCKA